VSKINKSVRTYTYNKYKFLMNYKSTISFATKTSHRRLLSVIARDTFPVESTKFGSYDLQFSPQISPSITAATANQRELTQMKIRLMINEFQVHKADKGSTSVQSCIKEM